jgi:hypothetical protein
MLDTPEHRDMSIEHPSLVASGRPRGRTARIMMARFDTNIVTEPTTGPLWLRYIGRIRPAP